MVDQNTIGRDRRNVMVGAPNVDQFHGYFLIGPVADNIQDFPKNANESKQAIADRLKMKTAGFITSDGISESEERSTEKIKDWNNDVIDVVTTDYGVQLTVTFAEAANAAVLKYMYGENNVEVLDGGGVHIKQTSGDLPRRSIMFDLKGKHDTLGRVFAAETQVVSTGEIAYSKQGLISYNATIDVFNDAQGTYLHKWLGEPVAEASDSAGSDTQDTSGDSSDDSSTDES